MFDEFFVVSCSPKNPHSEFRDIGCGHSLETLNWAESIVTVALLMICPKWR